MKKLLTFICTVMIIFTCTGCNSMKDVFSKEKPSNFFHTNNLISCYIDNSPNLVGIFDVNMHKQKNLNEEESFELLKFINSLRKEFAIEKIDVFDNKPVYKIFITFNKAKYVINVYDERYISIHPWDSELSMDYLDIKDIPISYNIYGLCKYFLKNPDYSEEINNK